MDRWCGFERTSLSGTLRGRLVRFARSRCLALSYCFNKLTQRASFSSRSFRCVTTCNHQHSRRVICRNFNWKHFSTFSTRCRRMFYKHTLRKNCILGNGGTTVNRSFGSNGLGRQTALQTCPPGRPSTSTSTSTHGNDAFLMATCRTLRAAFCRKTK